MKQHAGAENFLAQSVLLFGLLTFATVISAQEPSKFEVPTTNPKAVVQQRVAATDIEIQYNRPSVKGRVIFGELVPYAKVWRTGADAATRISFSTEINLGGSPIKPGIYELFSIPGPREWTVILHENRSQWGSYKYDSTHDVVRFTVKPQLLAERVETFSISVDNVTAHSAVLNISWDHIRVSLPILIDVRQTVLPQLEKSLQQEGKRPYFRAAMFYFENDLDINRAAELMQLAAEENPNHIGILHRLALILEKKGDKKGAKEAAERSLEGTASASEELRNEYRRLNTLLLERLGK